MLNKQKGNMYPFVTYTWNAIKGKCPHDCSYCYMKRFPQKDLYFDTKELKTNLGSGNFIFVGSSIDMFANDIPSKWIIDVLFKCFNEDKENKYLFQSKNPNRFLQFQGYFPLDSIFGTTIESNRNYNISNAPSVGNRAGYISVIPSEVMVSIEPIMDFDLNIFVDWIKDITPKFVSIGADSKGHNLPEPSWDKVQMLIDELKKFTEVKIKDNLYRLKKTKNNNGGLKR